MNPKRNQGDILKLPNVTKVKLNKLPQKNIPISKNIYNEDGVHRMGLQIQKSKLIIII